MPRRSKKSKNTQKITHRNRTCKDKLSFSSRELAQKKLQDLPFEHGNNYSRIYQCKECGQFHLTTH